VIPENKKKVKYELWGTVKVPPLPPVPPFAAKGRQSCAALNVKSAATWGRHFCHATAFCRHRIF
jgi:hypothetical protein